MTGCGVGEPVLVGEWHDLSWDKVYIPAVLNFLHVQTPVKIFFFEAIDLELMRKKFN